MARSRGYFMICSPNSYLFHLLICTLLFGGFLIATLCAYTWNRRIVNVSLFLAFAALQSFFLGLSLFSQKAGFDNFLMDVIELNTNNGNPLDIRTAARLFRLKFGRPGTVDVHEEERLRTYSMPTTENKISRANLSSDPREGDGYTFVPIGMAI
ncbi:hypothetical protein M3Y99_00836600 [Aphelenchoides fujianensis]|nr:hypothetical protein M3Y99_00836600 [Aphelenchoides fujianensis]